MASRKKQAKSIRKRKSRPNMTNVKKDLRRRDKNTEILRELAQKDGV